MTIRRVYVIWNHPLFHESVRLLLKHPDIEWAGATTDFAVAREQIASLRPDTVVIEEDAAGGLPDDTLQILEASPADVRVIRLSLADNELIVYHREKRTVRQAEDLLRLIQNS